MELAHSLTRLRGVLVVSQLAMSVILLVATSLFVRSLLVARTIDVGFDARDWSALPPPTTSFVSGLQDAAEKPERREIPADPPRSCQASGSSYSPEGVASRRRRARASASRRSTWPRISLALASVSPTLATSGWVKVAAGTVR